MYKIQQTDQVLSIYIKSHGSFFALTSLPGVNYTLYVYSYVYVIGSNGDIVGKASLSLSLSLSAREVLCQQSIQGVDITQKPVKKNVFAIQAKQDA